MGLFFLRKSPYTFVRSRCDVTLISSVATHKLLYYFSTSCTVVFQEARRLNEGEKEHHQQQSAVQRKRTLAIHRFRSRDNKQPQDLFIPVKETTMSSGRAPAFDLLKEESNKLFDAINRQEWERVIMLAKRSPNLCKEQCTVEGFYDARFSSSMPPLHLACAMPNVPLQVLQALHAANELGVKEPESTYARLPLHIAVMHGMATPTLGGLMKLCPRSTKTQDAHGRIPLHYACKSHGMTAVDEKNALVLVKAYPEGVRVADGNGFLPIHVACRSLSSRALIRMLVRSAPETIVAQTSKGNTAILCAKNSRYGDETERDEVVGMLERTVEEFGLEVPPK